MKQYCFICSNEALPRLKKNNIQYYQCTNCKTLYCSELDQDGLVGGGAEIERNTLQNHLRIERIESMSNGMKKEDVFILDWGAGHGYLINDLKKAGFMNTFGYDPYTEEFSQLPEKNKFNIIVSVECFEHMSKPFVEINAMHRSLKKNGCIYLETGFLNAAWDDGVDDEDNPYITPLAGHSTIFTHHGMDLLMALKNFAPCQKFNRHCHVYQKIER